MSTGRNGRREVARGELQLGSHRVVYRVVRSSRARHVRLRLLPDGTVEIVGPARGTLPPAEEVLRAQERWLCRRLQRLTEQTAEEPNRITLVGVEYRVVVVRRAGPSATMTLRAPELCIELPPGVDPVPVLETFLRRQARAVLHERVRHWAARMEVEYGRISVRDQRTRWGSCAAGGNLSFSWRLLLAPPAVLDYVVIHELMHRREMNHGPAFWRGVARHSPDFEQQRAWLRTHGALLARPLRVIEEP